VKSQPATPYLLPPDEAVIEQAWTDSQGLELPDRLAHWDPFTDFQVFRSIDVDLDVVRASCLLPEDAAFAVTTSWTSSRTRLSEPGPPVELGQLDGIIRASLTLEIPGARSGGRVDLRTALILRHPGSAPSPISPRRAGAILWTDARRISVEGGAARFPISAVDFTAAPGLPDGATWKLEWAVDRLDAPVLGDVRLLVNANNERLLAALRSGANDATAVVTRSFVLFDVARTLIAGALQNEQFVSEPERFDEGSIGRMLFELLSMYWPGVPIQTLASRQASNPARLEAELQAHLGVLV
jgi:hypothetical protein